MLDLELNPQLKKEADIAAEEIRLEEELENPKTTQTASCAPHEQYQQTTAPFPKAEVETEIRHWLSIVFEANDVNTDVEIIKSFHYKALATRIETILMKNGVYPWVDGRLEHNKKKKV